MKKVLAIILGITMVLGTSMFVSAEEIEPQNIVSEYNYAGSKANFQITISQEKTFNSFAKTAPDNIIITQLVETDLGVRESIIINDKIENQHLNITFTSGSDNWVQVEDDNSLIFFDGNNEMIGAANKLIVTDANNDLINVNARIINNVVRYDIDDRNAVYPLYGDIEIYGSDDFSQWFSKGEWITRDGKISLSLTHTGWAYLGISTGPITWSWNTVVNKFSSSSNWYNAQGMQEQYQCHVNFAAAKNPWNLEPWRPAVGYIETTKKECNP